MIHKDDLSALAKLVGRMIRENTNGLGEQLRAQIAAVRSEVAALPKPEKGDRGENGKDAEPVDIEALTQRAAELAAHKNFVSLDSIAERVVKFMPVPQNGRDGKDGTDGKDGINGEKGDQGERGEAGAKGEKGDTGDKGDTGERGEPGQRGEKGDTGERGLPGEAGAKGDTGERGERGADGKSVDPAEVERQISDAMGRMVGQWALDFERRAQDLFRQAIEKMPKPKDGRDAFELEDLSLEHDGDGNVTLIFKRGENEKRLELRVPRFKDKGVYLPAETYRCGDGVTFGGSFWIAQMDSPADKPGTGDGWRLAVKRGRDGRDGELKQPKPEGPVKL
jgi:integrin beta 3